MSVGAGAASVSDCALTPGKLDGDYVPGWGFAKVLGASPMNVRIF